MSFVSKNLQSKQGGLTFIKGATLFFLGMSAVLFLTQAFDIVPSVTNRAQLIKEVLFTADGSQSGNTGAYIDGSGGNAYFAGTITSSTMCLAGDTCRSTWPAGGESLWSTGTNNSIYYTGKVGIGVTSPSAKLEVSPSARFSIGEEAAIFVIEDSPNGTNTLQIDNDTEQRFIIDSNNVGYKVGIGTGTPSARLEVNGDVKVGSLLSLYSSYPNGYIQSEGKLAFNTSGSSTPKMTINKSGYVGIGMGQIDASTMLQVSGAVTANAYYYNSDINMKTDLSLITDPLSKILLLNGYMFTWKATDKRDMGVIAQEVEKVFPEIIHTDDQGYKSVEYGNLVAPLIEAIKELNQKLDEQAQKIQELEMK